ncbi:sensor histidine kinase [Hyalangium rubrum]|uniref:histidine kinase n=1 Tax=Hyalangium rubrum TaxID=3103134 RepID=A0ABU5HDJ9_9BACT|nr:ATP-binding protein [Hyalangium sp. s54d21]MDY7231345.1 ATP-binding protein [Hyalangium sp. s54d21]
MTIRARMVLLGAVASSLVTALVLQLRAGPAPGGGLSVGLSLGVLAVLAVGAFLLFRPVYQELRGLRAAEETVRTRTAQLEVANAQLADSLRRLQATQAQLVFADRLASMGQLAAGVGHEINNPLAYVLSNLHYLHKELNRTKGAPSEEERAELLTAVADAREGAERVRVIVQDLKMLSRPDEVSSGRVDLEAVLRRAMKLAAHEVGRRARLVEALNEVPWVLGSEARLGQVFLNLLLNAAQAIPKGKVEEHAVRVVARRQGAERVVVEVSDTGCGIAPENLERIFDPFFTTKPVGEGTGLGLSVCHGIIRSYGGEIHVESTPGRGSTFRVSLRVAPEVTVEREPGVERHEASLSASA